MINTKCFQTIIICPLSKKTHFIAVEYMARWKANSTEYFISWLPFSVCEPIKMENFIGKQ